MFDRKRYKKEGWEQSKGLARKMLAPSLVTALVFLAMYSAIYIPYVKQFRQTVDNLSQLEWATSGYAWTYAGGFLAYTLLNLFGFAWAKYVWDFQKTGDFSFSAFKKNFSFKTLRGALWYVLWSYVWLLPYLVMLFFGTKLSLEANAIPNSPNLQSQAIVSIILIYAGLFYMIFAYVKIIGYTMMPYVLAENPEISVTKAMNLSKKMCKGCRENILVMYGSFSLWYLFVLATLGFGRILYQPYIENSFIDMYKAVKKNALEAKTVSEEDFYVLQ